MPMTPFIGVRISWLMLATNSDFSREASRAACRARTRRSMLCTASTTPSTVPRESRQGCTVQRSQTLEPSARSSASSGSETTSPARAREKTSSYFAGMSGQSSSRVRPTTDGSSTAR